MALHMEYISISLIPKISKSLPTNFLSSLKVYLMDGAIKQKIHPQLHSAKNLLKILWQIMDQVQNGSKPSSSSKEYWALKKEDTSPTGEKCSSKIVMEAASLAMLIPSPIKLINFILEGRKMSKKQSTISTTSISLKIDNKLLLLEHSMLELELYSGVTISRVKQMLKSK